MPGGGIRLVEKFPLPKRRGCVALKVAFANEAWHRHLNWVQTSNQQAINPYRNGFKIVVLMALVNSINVTMRQDVQIFLAKNSLAL
jgi:hypothetical protein